MSEKEITLRNEPIASVKPGHNCPCAEDGKHVLSSRFYYSKGGMSYFSGKTSPRGYYVSFQPTTIREDGSQMFVIFSGLKGLVEEAKRFSAKRFSELANTVEKSDVFEKTRTATIEAEGLVMEAPAPARKAA